MQYSSSPRILTFSSYLLLERENSLVILCGDLIPLEELYPVLLLLPAHHQQEYYLNPVFTAWALLCLPGNRAIGWVKWATEVLKARHQLIFILDEFTYTTVEWSRIR